MTIKEQNLQIMQKYLLENPIFKKYKQEAENNFIDVYVDYDLINDSLRKSTDSSDCGKLLANTDPKEFKAFIDEILNDIQNELSNNLLAENESLNNIRKE